MHYCFLTTGTWVNNTNFMRFRDFGRQLLLRGHRVSYVVDDLAENDPPTMKLPDGAQIVRMPPLRGIGALMKRRAALRQMAPDWVHVLDAPRKTLAVLIGMKLRIVADWDEWFAARPGKISITRLIEAWADRWYRKHAERLVVCSRYLQNEFSKLGLNAAYIPYAAYLPPTLPDGESPYREPTAVYMGALFPAFDQDVLFHAAKLLQKRGVHPQVVFVGGGPELEKWKQFVIDEGLSNVRMLGYLEQADMFRHLRHAHVLMFPIRENMTNLCRCPSKTFAFAQARRPVVTNAVGEVPEVLGAKASYIACTPEAFADALIDTLGRPAPDVDYALETQQWSNRTDALLNFLQEPAT